MQKLSNPFEHWLSVDLSAANGSAAIHRVTDGAPICLASGSLSDPFKHSEQIVPLISDLLGEVSLSLERMDRFITNQGPGSFTGLRVAFATIKAFAMANAKPIETLSGSEARAMAWVAQAPNPLPYDDIFVLTHVSLNRFVQARFDVRDGNHLLMKNEILTEGIFNEPELETGIVLTDGKIPRELVPQAEGIEVIEFPVQARHLAEALPKASTHKTFSTIEEWVPLSPTYFGDKQ